MINSAKLTGWLFIAAIRKFLEHSQNKKTVIPQGKQSCEMNLLASSFIGQNQGVTSIESNDPDIKTFDKVARKYGRSYAVDCAVDYAIKKVKDENGKHKVNAD